MSDRQNDWRFYQPWSVSSGCELVLSTQCLPSIIGDAGRSAPDEKEATKGGAWLGTAVIECQEAPSFL
jgi:hypothetical protein